MNRLREKFVMERETTAGCATYLVVAVQLPNEALELITNTENIPAKCEYYLNAYDGNFCLKANPNIKIVSFMLI
jgi:hypothetical protein